MQNEEHADKILSRKEALAFAKHMIAYITATEKAAELLANNSGFADFKESLDYEVQKAQEHNQKGVFQIIGTMLTSGLPDDEIIEQRKFVTHWYNQIIPDIMTERLRSIQNIYQQKLHNMGGVSYASHNAFNGLINATQALLGITPEKGNSLF